FPSGLQLQLFDPITASWQECATIDESKPAHQNRRPPPADCEGPDAEGDCCDQRYHMRDFARFLPDPLFEAADDVAAVHRNHGQQIENPPANVDPQQVPVDCRPEYRVNCEWDLVTEQVHKAAKQKTCKRAGKADDNALWRRHLSAFGPRSQPTHRIQLNLRRQSVSFTSECVTELMHE